jgi:hypothetical protein
MCLVHNELYFSNYSVLGMSAQITTSHSYILEQLFFAALCKLVHLCLARGIDWPCFPRGKAMLPPSYFPAWCDPSAWLALVSFMNNLFVPSVP